MVLATFAKFIILLLIPLTIGCGLFQKGSPPSDTGQPGAAVRDPFKRGSNITGKLYWAGRADQTKMALTFDDGPEEDWTPKILDILKEKNVKATFFLIGHQAQKYPDMVKRIAAEGHVIGNHTYDHADLTKLRPEIVSQEIDKCSDVVEKIIGHRPRLVRPPFGFHNPAADEVIYSKNDIIVLWSVDPEDWKGLDAHTVKTRILGKARNGFISLQHDGVNLHLTGSVEALPDIIDGLRAQGYTLVTIPELLEQQPYH
ncbi:MAG: polysaccharide deacetylase family protein [Negativicutes bacterium]|nr:polysaccharide deacetylase family protein [Negativicutes bacterium]